jgi:hypothetical protein
LFRNSDEIFLRFQRALERQNILAAQEKGARKFTVE